MSSLNNNIHALGQLYFYNLLYKFSPDFEKSGLNFNFPETEKTKSSG